MLYAGVPECRLLLQPVISVPKVEGSTIFIITPSLLVTCHLVTTCGQRLPGGLTHALLMIE